MSLVHMQGDMFTTTAHHIGHGVNTQGVMGAGVAKAIREQFPTVYERYRSECLGPGLQPGETLSYLTVWPGTRRGVWVHNLASQDLPGRHANAVWLTESLKTMLQTIHWHGSRLAAIPRIGAGIGGLDWETEALPAMEAASAEFPNIVLEVWYL